MKYSVYLISTAEEDIFEIYEYIARHDSPQKADDVFSKLKEACDSLATLAIRGHVPPELDRISVRDYLEIHFKPYRIIYQIFGKKVFIHCVLDGRRDMEDLLQRRLIRSL
ncbi:MAG: type II toxin-antitoxin system RelE/ParE family toxin [Smithella sp.]|jgi:toxin ParE1/3/4